MLADCVNLQFLDLFDVPGITDQSLTNIICRCFPQLQTFYLSGSAIENWKSIAFLISCTMLRELILQQSCVNDECIQYLVQLPDLHTLDIQSSSITKQSLCVLAQKGSIRKVNVSKCEVAVPMTLYCRTPLINWNGTVRTTVRGMKNLLARQVVSKIFKC